MTAAKEITVEESFGQGLYSADLPSAIPEGYSALATNVVPTGTSLENRFGFETSTVNFHEEHNTVLPLTSCATYLGVSGIEDNPTMIWGEMSDDSIFLMREGTPYLPSTDPNNPNDDGLIEIVSFGSEFRGSCNYNNRFYLAVDDGIHKIDSIDWDAGSVVTTAIAGAPNDIDSEIIQFFDRLWVASGYKLFYTDVPSTPGDYPETWDLTENFVPVIGSRGPGKIFKIVPLGTRLFIFTSTGLFALTVVGPPESWYLKFVDESVRVNTPQCAFEREGLLYYVTVDGVYVTTGAETVRLSGSITNYFLAGNFDALGVELNRSSNLYRLVYLDGGMILSISQFEIINGQGRYVPDGCHVFYSRLDNVAWSEWNFSAKEEPLYPDTSPTGTQHQIIAVEFVADNVESYLNRTPLSYCMVLHGHKTAPANSARVVREMMVYDGLEDIWEKHSSDNGDVLGQSRIISEVYTRYFDLDDPINLKTMKYGYLSLYLSAPEFYSNQGTKDNWEYTWYTDFTTFDFISEHGADLTLAPIHALEFVMFKIRAGFQHRSAQFAVRLSTNNDCTFKIRSLYMQMQGDRDGPQSVQ